MNNERTFNLISTRTSHLIVMFGLPALIMLVTIAFVVGLNLDNIAAIFDGGIFVILVTLACLLVYTAYVLAVGHGFLIQIVVNDDAFQSVWFKKKLCRVDRHKEIYYILFEAKEELSPPAKQFLLLSNLPINVEHEQKLSPVYYKHKKYVILPYNDETKPYLDLDNWTCSGLYLKTL